MSEDRPFSARDLRDALSTFATGVTIVTARDANGEPVGMTASSFNSVSMEPPLVLWSVAKASLSANAFRDAREFSIHILSSDQVDLSNRFARSGEDKFSGVEFAIDHRGIPVLSGAVCRFDCRQFAVYEGGDHWIIVGQVTALNHVNAEGLVFSGGSYATASSMRPSVPEPDAGDEQASAIDGLLIYNLSRAYRQISDQFHNTVRENGLGISEWRILASLHGRVTRSISDLAERTFVDPKSLMDLVAEMEEEDLCRVQTRNGELVVSGTDNGHERVDHLFALSRKQERAALGRGGDAALRELIPLLKQLIHNTSPSRDD